MHPRRPEEGKFFAQSTPAEVKKLEQEIARLNGVLKNTPPEQKKILSDARSALADTEYQLKIHRENVASAPEALLKRKENELAAARAELVRVEKHHPADKALLSGSRSTVWDLEASVNEMRKRSSQAGNFLGPRVN